MGAPISSVIAQLVMEDLEETIIPTINIKLPFFKRYVDDCLIGIPENKLDYIINTFNSYHPKLQFTSEVEQNGKIIFLDMSLIRDYHRNKILTKWYTKPTASGRYMNFQTNQSMSIKKSVVIGLVDRVLKLTSVQYREECLNQVKKILTNNNYPNEFTNNIIKKRIHKLYNTNRHRKKDTNDIKYIPIPYVAGLSENLNKMFKNYNLRIAHKNYNNLNFTKTKLKDKTPLNKQTHAVYSIPCRNCNKIYIGQTKQHLQERIKGHKYSKNITALKKHENEYAHSFNYENTTILAKEKNSKARSVLEMIQIKKNINIAVNNRSDIENLAAAYFSIM